jgi:hypothetical protein
VSLRDRLEAKRARTLAFRLAVDDFADLEPALLEVRVEVADLEGEDADAAKLAEAKTRLASAQAAYDACFEWLTLRALPAGEWEKLIALHPPTAEQAAKDSDALWDSAGLRDPLIAACVDGDEDVTWWSAFLAERCSTGERDALYFACQSVNIRTVDPYVPKG